MHEASLMRSLLRKIEELAQAQGDGKIVCIRVWLGALSHMSPDHFKEHFDQISPGSIAENAALEFDVSDDIHDPNAQQLVLQSIDFEA